MNLLSRILDIAVTGVHLHAVDGCRTDLGRHGDSLAPFGVGALSGFSSDGMHRGCRLFSVNETQKLLSSVALWTRVFEGFRIIKRQRIVVRCLRDFFGLFHGRFERVVAQICYDLRVERSCGKHLVAFPAAQGDRANCQSASSLRLVEFQLEPGSAQVAADGGRRFWDWNSTVVRGQIFVPWDAHVAITKRQRRARRTARSVA